MSAPIPLRQDFDASQLRGLAKKTKDGPQAQDRIGSESHRPRAGALPSDVCSGVNSRFPRDKPAGAFPVLGVTEGTLRGPPLGGRLGRV